MENTSQFMGSLSSQDQALLDEVGPRWAENINLHRDLVVRTYTPLVLQADNRGIDVARDLPYGAESRQVLDVYSRSSWAGESRDVVVFFHGGAFIRGSKSTNGAIYDNVAYWFARQGCVAVNVEYRLAPQTAYPGGATDVVDAARWVRENIERFGGNLRRIFLMGHSAGGSHVASALFDPAVENRLTQEEVAGVILVSARLQADVLPDNPNANGVRAYFGEDEKKYVERSPSSHVSQSNVPLFIAVAEYENTHLDRYGHEFYASAQASSRTALTRFCAVPRHNHTLIVAHFNSGEETLGPQLLAFMQAVR